MCMVQGFGFRVSGFQARQYVYVDAYGYEGMNLKCLCPLDPFEDVFVAYKDIEG